MGFATAWLNSKALFHEFINETPGNQTGIIVVVPAFDEPSITSLLDSLKSCDKPACGVEVIIVINAPMNASGESIRNNSVCKRNISKWDINNKEKFFNIYLIDTGVAPVSGWGVGLARKSGMDEALRRFNKMNNPEGIIVCLDADCTVEKNYFKTIYNEFYRKKERKACSIYFEHPLTGNQYPEKIYSYITQYELHLRYFVQGLRYSGFPYPFHTVGSAIAVRALQYVKAGGMNRKQAGEDFYFVQKLVPLGGYFSMSDTTVYPSSRESFRVPFGTGVTINKLMGETGSKLQTYCTEAFGELKILFNMVRELYAVEKSIVIESFNRLPAGLRTFIGSEEWYLKINEIQRNTSSSEAFLKRFFTWFNMFRIVKYLNNIHSTEYKKIPIEDAAGTMLKLSGFTKVPKDSHNLLMYYRDLDRGIV